MKSLRAIGAALGAVLMLAACGKGDPVIQKQGHLALGASAEEAKVTLVEYTSITCATCAQWRTDVWPEFKAKYVDTKKVRYVLHEFPTPPQDTAVTGFLVARCAGTDAYFDVVDKIMKAQAEMATSTPRTVLMRIAQEQGLDEIAFKDCISDPEAVAAMGKRVAEAQAAGITDTPAFSLNGEILTDQSLKGLSDKIDALLETQP